MYEAFGKWKCQHILDWRTKWRDTNSTKVCKQKTKYQQQIKIRKKLKDEQMWVWMHFKHIAGVKTTQLCQRAWPSINVYFAKVTVIRSIGVEKKESK